MAIPDPSFMNVLLSFVHLYISYLIIPNFLVTDLTSTGIYMVLQLMTQYQHFQFGFRLPNQQGVFHKLYTAALHTFSFTHTHTYAPKNIHHAMFAKEVKSYTLQYAVAYLSLNYITSSSVLQSVSSVHKHKLACKNYEFTNNRTNQ